MQLRMYNTLEDGRQVFELWQTHLSSHYPLNSATFLQHTSGRISYEDRDSVVAELGGKIVGFGIVEIDRLADGVCDGASVTVVVVDANERRQGIGRAILEALEERLRRQGLKRVNAGGNYHAFWPGIPEYPTGVVEFFRSCGYVLGDECFDLLIPLEDSCVSEKSKHLLKKLGVQIENLTLNSVGNVIEFQRREFPWWVDPLLKAFPADMSNVIIACHGHEVIGSLIAFTPSSRFRVGGVQRARQLGCELGALGAVGIAETWRGKGLGRAMCEVAFAHIRECGGTHCYIEEVEPHIVPFYEKMGATILERFRQATKPLS